MKYCLVLLRSGESAVVPASSLRTAGKFLKEKWENGRSYLVRILAKSNFLDDSVFLQSLSVERNRVIVFGSETSTDAGGIGNPSVPSYQASQEEDLTKANAAFNDDPKKPCCSRVLSPVLESSPQENTPPRQAPLGKSTVGSQTDDENVGNCQACNVTLKSLTTEHWVQTDSVSTESRSSQCQLEMISIGTNTKAEDPSTSDQHDFSHERIHDNDMTASVSSDHGIIVSTGNGTTDDDVGNRDHGLSDSSDDNDGDLGDRKINIIRRNTFPWTQSGNGKAELVPGANVSIASDPLFTTIADCYQNPRELIRRLLRLIIPQDQLLKMTVTGRGWNRRPIPPDVLNAVENCMKANIEEQLWLSETEFRSVVVKTLDKMRQASNR